MILRPGMRVRKVANMKKADRLGKSGTFSPFVPLGIEGTIVRRALRPSWLVAWDGHPSRASHGLYRALDYMLAPLVDPDFNKFMERVLKPIKRTRKQKETA